MFRELTRKKQQLTQEKCIEILKNEKRGVLCVLGDDDYPYAVPINHWYCEEDGKIYFHSGKFGHKIDAMRKHNKVSFCVYDKGYLKEGDWALNISSVIVFGRVNFIDDREKALDISRKLSYKFTSDESYIDYEIEHSGKSVLCFELVPEHISGKLVNEK
ncbi:MAG: pyridoxamine 5'-phosphate oxidase family protein [Clostridia bacterium]|nr:pyridoxamine 5'-phosphate oxidase family protein [Clostridia bacterium]